jgi:peptide/nickel transport system permease protein
MSDASRQDAAAVLVRRSWWGQVGLRLMGRWGARVGLAWVVLLVLMAVFAPLLANSHPLIWSVNGTVASPMVSQLTATDVTLLISFAVALVLCVLRRVDGRLRLWLWVGATVMAGGICYLTVPAREAVVYEQYRVQIEKGDVDWAVHAPIRYSPADFQRDYFARTQDSPGLQPPSLQHPLGTTTDGLDLASCMIHASRIALSIGLISTGIAVFIGILVGGVMGYFSGWVDLVGMRVVEIFAAIPTIFLLIMICAFWGRDIYLMMVVLGLTGWVGYAMFIRAEFLKLRQMDYVQAARATGIPTTAILFRHMLPNGVTPVLVLASFGIASAILTESTLSFLGLGLPPHETSWGQLLSEANLTGGAYWWLLIYPGLAIFLTVFAYNLVGEALRDAIDPHTQRATHL